MPNRPATAEEMVPSYPQRSMELVERMRRRRLTIHNIITMLLVKVHRLIISKFSRSREASRGTTGGTSGVRLTGGSSLVFIDPASLRRSAAAAAAAGAHDPHSTSTTAACLARAFGKLFSYLELYIL